MSSPDVTQLVLWFQSTARLCRWLGVLIAFCLVSSDQPLLLRGAVAASSPTRPALTLLPNSSHPQGTVAQDQTTLIAGVPVSRKIKGGESQSFKLWVPPGQYFRLRIKQSDIILEAVLSDSHSNQVVKLDNPGGGNGPIYISAIAAGSGEYRLEVRSAESWANAGRFEAIIDEQREATPEDKIYITAQLAFGDARRLAEQETKESREAALKKFQDALADWQRLGNTHWQVLTLYSIGSTYRRLGEMGHAAEYFAKSLHKELIGKLEADDWRLIASILNNGGLTKADLGDDVGAFESLNQALKLYQEHGDKPGEASALNNLGYTYYKLGRFHEAAENFEKSLPLRRAENNQLREFNVVNNLGAVYDALGEPQKALESCSKTLEVWRALYKEGQLSDPDRLAAALNNTAAAYDRLGEWQEALNSYEEALSILRKSGNVQRQAATLDNIGELHQVLGDSSRALEYYDGALNLIREKVKDPKAEANVLAHIGQVYVSEGNLNGALKYFKALREIPQSPQRKAELLTNLGMVYSLQGNAAEARTLYEEALAIFRANGDLRGQAAALHKLAEAYRQLGNDSLAVETLNLALPLWRTIKDRRGEALTLQGIAQITSVQNELTEALQLNEDAMAIIESLRTKVSSHRLRTSYFATQENYYELNIDLNMKLYRHHQSPENLAAALEASERSRARSLMDTLIEAHTNITEGASEVLLREEHEVQQRLNAKSEAQTRLLSMNHHEQEAMVMAKEISELIAEHEAVRDKIRAGSSRYIDLARPQALTLHEIQQIVDDDTLLLEYALGDKRSYAWVVSRRSIHGVELVGRDEIEAAAHRVTEALTARNRDGKNETFSQKQLRVDKAERDFPEAAAALSKLVIDPVASHLDQKRLVVVADGALQMVPFATLSAPATSPTSENVKQSSTIAAVLADPMPMINKYEIVSLPSASVLALQRRELADRKGALLAVAVLADPVFDKQDQRVARSNGNGNQHRKDEATRRKNSEAPSKQGGPALPTSPVSPETSAATNESSALTTALRDIGADPNAMMRRLLLSRQEAKAISQAVPANQSLSALDFAASRATAMSPELAKYRIIHFATHGVLDLEHPELSGIVLSMVDEKGQPQDGYLRLHEIYNLNLPAELVVLSACQTGIGKQIKGEGLIALTRGFMYAGAKSVVASLWKVDDAATSALMAEFYKQMFTNKLKPAAALRAAQVTISQQKRWRSPYYWAGFFIQGEWN